MRNAIISLTFMIVFHLFQVSATRLFGRLSFIRSVFFRGDFITRNTVVCRGGGVGRCRRHEWSENIDGVSRQNRADRVAILRATASAKMVVRRKVS